MCQCELIYLRVNYRPSQLQSYPVPTALTSPLPNLHAQCFALLDDAQSKGTQSRLYTELLTSLQCDSADAWDTMWSKAETYLAQGFHLLALLQYETGAQLHTINARPPHFGAASASQILVFQQCQLIDHEAVAQLLQQHCDTHTAGLRQLHANVDEAEFTRAIKTIRNYIAAGDSYQVNYTYRLHFQSYGSVIALYRALRERQPVPYAALIVLPDQSAILSLSPELFIRHQDGKLKASPMKGTAAASGDAQEDEARANALQNDVKNRAENLMIVDLLRNDLGRIARTGSVRVPALFQVQRFSSVLQMTSDIEADLRDELGYAQIMAALFPCGSITGAPKRRTMEIIREIESTDRGIYTGAIGWFDPPTLSNRIGDFCLSVPIRTLQLQAPDAQGLRQGRMGVGAGIVYDSVDADEFKECQLKARFLTGYHPTFSLIETMYATREHGCRHLEYHLQRLQTSAEFFEFHCDLAAIKTALNNLCQQCKSDTAYRLKLALQHDGSIELQHAPLVALQQPVKLMLSSDICPLDPLFIAHKTSHRAVYDQAWQNAERAGAFDQLFINRVGNITEGGRSSVFIRQGQQWWTPPLSDGVLPGIMRRVFLEDATLQVAEKSLTREDLLNADEIVVCNALRGRLSAQLVL